MKRGIAVVVFIAIGVFSGNSFAGGPIKYNADEFKNIEKMVGKVVRAKLENLKKHNVKKVAIIECFGEFLVSKESGDAFSGFAWQGGSTRSTKVTIGSDYYETVTNVVYDLTRKIFEDNGIEVVPKDTLLANSDYTGLGLQEERKGGGYKGGVMKEKTVTKTVKRSASDMGIFGGLKAAFQVQDFPIKFAMATGADGTIRVNYFVGIGKDFAPLLNSFNITMTSDLAEANAGRGKKTYYFKSVDVPLLQLKAPVASTVDARAQKGALNMDVYNDALQDILNSIDDMYSYSVKKALN